MISVRRLETDDLQTRVEWFNSPKIFEQMVIEPPASLAATQQWFLRAAGNPERRDFVFEKGPSGTDAEAVSTVAMGGLTHISARDRTAELYILVHPELLGQGSGSRATMWLCNFGFEQLGLDRIYLYTMAQRASQ